jgi:BMFP domain-containing protein YqiC
MPVTARLSRLFYERLGEQIANELVDWFNSVDATYRADLRTLNELNFARFDARLEQRMAELEARLEQRMTTLEAKLEQRMTALEAKLEQRMTALEARVDVRLAELQATLERRLGEQTRWLFAAWASLLIPIIGLWMRR